jgi:hypothetical protein
MKIGKRNGKRKGKKISLLTGPGGFRPSRGACARGRAACGPTQPASGSGVADGVVGVGPRASEEEVMALGGDGGANRPESAVGEVPQRFSVAVPVSGGRGGGLAWTRVGDHGGGVNLVGGCSGVHGEVAGARDGEAAGEANGCNKRGEKVCRARGEVVELKSYNNLTRTQQREESGAHRRGEGRRVELD